MARPKVQFTEEINFRISQLVEVDKSVKEIVEDLYVNFNIKFNEETTRRQIKNLGLKKSDCREKKHKESDFNEAVKMYIESQYMIGESISHIKKNIQSEYGIDVTKHTIKTYIEKNNIKRYKLSDSWEEIESNFDAPFINKIMDGMIKTKEAKYLKNLIEANIKLFDYFENDKQLQRYHRFFNTLYNIEDDKKETWYNRDGFPIINISNNIYCYYDNTYETEAGKYVNEYSNISNLSFYTNPIKLWCIKEWKSENVSNIKERVSKKKEIVEWYESNKPIINSLYDKIYKDDFSNESDIKEFNTLCERLYELKLEYGDLVASTATMKHIRAAQEEYDGFKDFCKTVGITK